MSNRAYKIILASLTLSLIAILSLQAYWLRNFYRQELESFNRNVYAALEQIREKIQEQENLHAIKMTYFIQNGDTIAKTPSRKLTVITDEHSKVVNTAGKSVSTRELISIKKVTKGLQDCVMILDRGNDVNILVGGKKAKVDTGSIHHKFKKLIVDNETEHQSLNRLEKLMNKMITEVNINQVEESSSDSLQFIIKRTLNNKGLSIPFEFALQKTDSGHTRVLAKSSNFDGTQKVYKSDLSLGKVFNTHKFLLLQFPSQDGQVFASMQNSIWLSLIFSFIIGGTFFYTIRLLRIQKKIAEIKTDFVNNMTHELKTPIATISLALDAMNNPSVKNDPDKTDGYRRILKEENQKLNSHVERVLQMSMLDKGTLELHRTEVDLNTIIQNAIKMYQLQIREQQAEVVFKPEEPLMIRADVVHFSSVINNLLDNALKYSGSGSRIGIEVQRKGKEIFLRISDNGIGISKEQQEKIFDKFYRVQGGNLHDVKGFGLGLSYVKSIVEAHGGTISVMSEKGKGSEFIIGLDTV